MSLVMSNIIQIPEYGFNTDFEHPVADSSLFISASLQIDELTEDISTPNATTYNEELFTDSRQRQELTNSIRSHFGLFPRPKTLEITEPHSSPAITMLGYIAYPELATATYLFLSDEISNPPSKDNCPKSEIAKNLVAEFDTALGRVDLAQVAVHNGEKPIHRMEAFSLIPVISTVGNQREIDIKAGYSVTLPHDVVSTYEGDDGTPYVDAAQAIGLTYDNRLIAIAGATVDVDGNILIVQIQDVSNVRKSKAGKAYYKTGLHNGLQWRDTLVRAWESVAEHVGANGVVIQSNGNNDWSKVREAGSRGYDDVAQRMGYVFDETSKNWVKPTVN